MEATPRDQTREAAHPGRAAVLVSLPLVVSLTFLDSVLPPLGIPVALLAIMLLFRWSRQGWLTLGLRRPRSWPATIAAGIGATLSLQALVMFAIFPLLQRLGFPLPDYSRFEAIQGNIPMLLVFLTVSWTTAGFGEEIIWRGFVMRRVAWLFGDGRAAWLVSLGLTSATFGLLHFYQGTIGIVMTATAGLVLGALYVLTGRNLWACIIAHGTTDTVSFLLIYSGVLESLT